MKALVFALSALFALGLAGCSPEEARQAVGKARDYAQETRTYAGNARQIATDLEDESVSLEEAFNRLREIAPDHWRSVIDQFNPESVEHARQFVIRLAAGAEQDAARADEILAQSEARLAIIESRTEATAELINTGVQIVTRALIPGGGVAAVLAWLFGSHRERTKLLQSVGDAGGTVDRGTFLSSLSPARQKAARASGLDREITGPTRT